VLFYSSAANNILQCTARFGIASYAYFNVVSDTAGGILLIGQTIADSDINLGMSSLGLNVLKWFGISGARLGFTHFLRTSKC
jgi:hypothetical protein